MRYGHVPRRHARKIEPWVVRLESAINGLNEDVASGNKMETLRSLEDVWFWVGRTMCEMLSSQAQMATNPKLAARAQSAMTEAAGAAARAKQWLGGA